MAQTSRVIAAIVGLLLLLNLSDLNPLLAVQQYRVAYNQVVDAAMTTLGGGVFLVYPVTVALLIYGLASRSYLSRLRLY